MRSFCERDRAEFDVKSVNREYYHKYICEFDVDGAIEKYRYASEGFEYEETDFECKDGDDYLLLEDEDDEDSEDVEATKNEEEFWRHENAIQTEIKRQCKELRRTLTLSEETRSKMRGKGSMLPSEYAATLADFLLHAGQIETAVKLFNMAAMSLRNCADECIETGFKLLYHFNTIVDIEKPRRPTSILFSLIQQAIKIFDNYELDSYFDTEEMIRVRNMMVRWPISPYALSIDDYYGKNALLKKLYAENFVDSLLLDVKRMNRIFSAKRYDDSTLPSNLYTALRSAGFVEMQGNHVYKTHKQFIWASPKGYVVRVKKNEKQKWEYTVGLTYFDLLRLSGKNYVKTTKRDFPSGTCDYFAGISSYDDLASYQANEICKVIVDGSLVMIAPSTKAYFWVYDTPPYESLKNGEPRYKDVVMGLAHREIYPSRYLT